MNEDKKLSRTLLIHADKFTGTEDIRKWLYNIEWFAAINEQPLKHLVPALLRDNALEFIMSKNYDPNNIDYKTIKTALEERYLKPEKTKREYAEEANSRQLKRSDDPYQYVHNFKDLLNKAFNWENEANKEAYDIIRFIIDSLPGDMKRLFIVTPAKLEHVIEGIINYRKLEQEQSNKSNRRFESKDKLDGEESKCFYCGKGGHRKEECFSFIRDRSNKTLHPDKIKQKDGSNYRIKLEDQDNKHKEPFKTPINYINDVYQKDKDHIENVDDSSEEDPDYLQALHIYIKEQREENKQFNNNTINEIELSNDSNSDNTRLDNTSTSSIDSEKEDIHQINHINIEEDSTDSVDEFYRTLAQNKGCLSVNEDDSSSQDFNTRCNQNRSSIFKKMQNIIYQTGDDSSIEIDSTKEDLSQAKHTQIEDVISQEETINQISEKLLQDQQPNKHYQDLHKQQTKPENNYNDKGKERTQTQPIRS
jgi:hypothetical protein